VTPSNDGAPSHPPMAVAIGHVIRGILDSSEIDVESAAVNSKILAHYLRHVDFDGEVNAIQKL
jgi:hypothetical protein